MRHTWVRDVCLMLAITLAGMGFSAPSEARDADYDPWPGIKEDVFDNRDIIEDAKRISLDAPDRAEDAAIVPVTMRIAPEIASSVKDLWLVIDKNPAPVAAQFSFGTAAGEAERVITTRIRIDEYSHVRAIAETDDGKLYMAAKFVKAAGGCSAPALKDADAALAEVGRMKVRTFDTASMSSGTRTGQLMIKHPQYSGLQMNQLTGLYIPAKFITNIEIKRGDEVVLDVTGGISLSEDPNIRFTYAAGGDEALQVVAKDTDGRTMTGQSLAEGS